MKVRFELYNVDGVEAPEALLVLEGETFQAYDTGEAAGCYYVVYEMRSGSPATAEDIAELEALLEPGMTASEVREVLAGSYFELGRAPLKGIISVEDYEVLYCDNPQGFMLASDLASMASVFASHDKMVWLGEPEHTVEVDDEAWDRLGNHAEFCAITALDGEPVEGQFLVCHWSQWHGIEPTGEIVTGEELEELKRGYPVGKEKENEENKNKLSII